MYLHNVLRDSRDSGHTAHVHFLSLSPPFIIPTHANKHILKTTRRTVISMALGALQELSSSEELSSFLSTNEYSLVCFSA
jgi:hypothetical protein